MTLDEKAKEVGSRIFQMRKALGPTQEKLAELIGYIYSVSG